VELEHTPSPAPQRFQLFVRAGSERPRAQKAGALIIPIRQLHFFIAEEGITAAAYVVISIVGRTWTIEECGNRDPSGARVGAILQPLIAREPVSSAGRRSVPLSLMVLVF
jgi:hypothetical protein